MVKEQQSLLLNRIRNISAKVEGGGGIGANELKNKLCLGQKLPLIVWKGDVINST